MGGVEDQVVAGCDDASASLSRARGILRMMADHRFGPPARMAELAVAVFDALVACQAAITRARQARSTAPRGRQEMRSK